MLHENSHGLPGTRTLSAQQKGAAAFPGCGGLEEGIPTRLSMGTAEGVGRIRAVESEHSSEVSYPGRETAHCRRSGTFMSFRESLQGQIQFGREFWQFLRVRKKWI